MENNFGAWNVWDSELLGLKIIRSSIDLSSSSSSNLL